MIVSITDVTSNAFFTVDVTFDGDIDATLVDTTLLDVLGVPCSGSAVQLAGNVVRITCTNETPTGFPWVAHVDFTPGFAPEQVGTVG